MHLEEGKAGKRCTVVIRNRQISGGRGTYTWAGGEGLYALYMVVARRLGRKKKKEEKDAVVHEYKKKTDQVQGWRSAGWCLLRIERSRIYRH